MFTRLLHCGLVTLALAITSLPVTLRADACANCALSCATGPVEGCTCCGGPAIKPGTTTNLHEFVGSATISPNSDIIDVDVANFQFTDSDIEINLGDTVRWTVSSGFHTVTSDTNAWVSSPGLGFGDTFQVTFNLEGTYAYHCMFHGGVGGQGMSGTVTVIPEPGASILLVMGLVTARLLVKSKRGAGGTS